VRHELVDGTASRAAGNLDEAGWTHGYPMCCTDTQGDAEMLLIAATILEEELDR
jgi:hypothetical protein